MTDMKKILYFLFVIPILAFMSQSCDDNDTPDVNFHMRFVNATVSDGDIYVVQGDTLTVDSAWVTAVNPSHKADLLPPVNYEIAGVGRFVSPFAPYRLAIPTDSLEVGTYQFAILGRVAEVNCSLGIGVAQATLNVVANASDIPTGTTSGNQVDIHRKI